MSRKLWVWDVGCTLGAALVALTCVYLWQSAVGHFTTPIGLWAASEVAFFALQRWRYHKINAMPERRPGGDVGVRVRQFLTLVNVVDIRDFLSGWFFGAPFETLRRENVLDFVAYGFWYKDRAAMSPEEQAEVERTLILIEKSFGVDIPPGRSPRLEFMAHLWQPLRVVHKPLALHVTSEASVILSHFVLWMMGFRAYSVSGFVYWAKGVPPPQDGSGGQIAQWRWLAQDAKDLIRGGPLPMSAAKEDPFDLLSSVAPGSDVAVARDYRARLRAAVADGASAFQRAFGTLASSSLRGGSAGLEAFDASSDLDAVPLPDTPSKATRVSLMVSWRRHLWAGAAAALCGVSLPAAHELQDLFSDEPDLELASSMSPRFKDSKAAQSAPPGTLQSAAKKATAVAASPREISPVLGKRQAREHPSSAPTALKEWTEQREQQHDELSHEHPLVFLHGVGFGMLPYLAFVRKLMAGFRTSPMLLLEVRHVSLRLCTRARGMEDVVQAVAAMMQRHGVQSGHFCAHSFGTFIVAQIRHLYPSMVESVLLCDPVCLLTCYPQLLTNFVYRSPRASDAIFNPMNVAKLAIARDLIIAEAFCRNFWWHTLMLWPTELPDVSVISLSASDELVPCELVMQQLKAGFKDESEAGESDQELDYTGETSFTYGVKVFVSKGAHGAFLFKPKLQDQLIDRWRTLLLECNR